MRTKNTPSKVFKKKRYSETVDKYADVIDQYRVFLLNIKCLLYCRKVMQVYIFVQR
jgi:hypothetical protein